MPTTNFITLDQAKQLTTKFRGSKDTILEPTFKGKGVLPVCETFGRAAFDAVLAKKGCVGLRIYFAMDETNLVKLVIVGVNANNEDMLPPTDAGGKVIGGDGDEIIEDGIRCPEICPPPSPLNG